MVKNLSTISITDGQPSKALCMCDHLLPRFACMNTPPSPFGPHHHCMSSNCTHTPFTMAALHRPPSWAHIQKKPTGLRPGAHMCSTLLPQTALPIHSYSSCKGQFECSLLEEPLNHAMTLCLPLSWYNASMEDITGLL